MRALERYCKNAIQWKKDSNYRREYVALEEEFPLVSEATGSRLKITFEPENARQ